MEAIHSCSYTISFSNCSISPVIELICEVNLEYQMEVSGFTRHRAISASSDDEIEGLNEQLIRSLSQFKFPPPPNISSVHKTHSLSGTNSDNDTDTLSEQGGSATPPSSKHYGFEYSYLQHGSPVNPQTLPRYLPPIGVFWDIENCQVPKGRSAVAVTQVIRDSFFSGYREAEFIVVCDVKKENNQVVQELNDAQVNLIHVASTCKNAADEKLRQSIRRFADIHGSPAAIILISGDINFAVDLSDLRHRKKIHVILLHKENTSEALILCANEHYNFIELMEPLPSRTVSKLPETYDLLVNNLPKEKDIVAIRRRLKQLSDNCGGKVVAIQSNTATVRFTSADSSIRAQKRMHGEDVFGSKILVRFSEERDEHTSKTQGSNTSQDCTATESESVIGTPGKMYTAGSTLAGARSLPVTPHYHSSSPIIGAYSTWGTIHSSSVNVPPGLIQQTPVFRKNVQSSSEASFNRSLNELPRSHSPFVWQQVGNTQRHGFYWEGQYKNEDVKVLGKRASISQARDTSTLSNNDSVRTPEGYRRIRGTHSYVHPPDWKPARQQFHLPNPSYNGNGYLQSNSIKRRSPSPMTSAYTRDHAHWNGQVMPPRSSRTPSPYDGHLMSSCQHEQSRLSPYHQNDPESEEVENFFNPISNRNFGVLNGACTPIELQVTNLDQNIEPKEMKRILASVFMEHVMVLHVFVFMQSDGNFAASVKVPSLQDAQYAISQLHRRKVGFKRILISYAHTGGPNPQLVRSQIVMLLQEVPGHKLPLFKFREMYERRFVISISVSELYKMKDVCIVTEDSGGRMVSLNPDHRNTPSPCFGNSTPEGVQLEMPYCTMHTQKPWSDRGWAEQEMLSLPNVKISLKLLTDRLQQLLKTHNGSLPLLSLPTCYEAEFTEKFEVDENGVPLEHLVACLSSIELKQGPGGVKFLIWAGTNDNDDSHEDNKCVSPPLVNQLALFSRELVDLLKTAPHCQLPFNRFIPAYHHHFGRQCRVADYGFTKLIDLLEALTHTVQVMGDGNKRVVTLSHRAQVRRFTSDLLRVLKAQASKQVSLSEFPSVYSRVIAKPWDVVDYGVCAIEDILGEVSENTVVVTNHDNNDKMIAIPKREQTAEEIERTKQFALEVVKLLGHAPQCRMLFNKFVPSYHHHFGHQCRVSDYGFTKLIELFEAIPHIVKIEETSGGERCISLTEKEGLRVLGEQVAKLVSRAKGVLPVAEISQAFLHQFGYALCPDIFNCSSILQLMGKLFETVKISQTATGPVVTSVDKSRLQVLALQCRRVLMDQPQRCLSVPEFQSHFIRYYASACDLGGLQRDLSDVVEFSSVNGKQMIELTPLQSFACNLYKVLMNYGGVLPLSQFENAYLSIIGSACQVAQFGFSTLTALLQALKCTVILKEPKHRRKTLYLNKKLATVGFPLPSTYSVTSPNKNTESSNDSFDSDTSGRLDLSNASLNLEELSKWPPTSVNIHHDWSHKELSQWSQKNDTQWSAVPESEAEQSHKWSAIERKDDKFLQSLIRTSPGNQELPPPPKPDSPNDGENDNKQRFWNSAVWASPPNYKYSQRDQSAIVVVPALTLPHWDQMTSDESTSNLLSPAKNLLPAAANPLNPRTSPYYSSRSPVIAPHPSELPFPSLSLTPKKSALVEVIELRRNNDFRTDGNSLEDQPGKSQTSETDSSEALGKGRITPAKQQLISGKRRLAAQFSQPINS
ncbi:meiosis regulator and mRNA stability factor 1 isoform X2 [Neodiprion virginianus]|uniref:meiosis regulator and mRNA stability factor 1 isoform X2 n=1 Tax=Neodiprion virginianus TaxID=2961670 RepID=UPI001EE72FBD|nr:meiosis regulator and mRNA stability factor 1 isoform X2 [Neodiprion virginianus]